MNIRLKPDLEAILKKHVVAGDFLSVEDALAAAIQGLDAAVPGDLSWAKPYLAEADADIEAGRTRPHDEVWADIEKHIGKR